ncbi:MAG: hypothetical protein RI947_1073 [Candidatus Parcubacteria bacterium]|jgi:murein DD-endopeptidase MepM/ murein hydrolase activator NlpD
MENLQEFLLFFRQYIKSRLLQIGRGFEGVKDVVVAFLIVKRGKYSSSFLNTSFFMLTIAAIIGGPIIAENNPFISSFETSDDNVQGAIVAYSPTENSFTTIISSKPRDKVIEYKVQEGDTIASIAKKFDVSVDSIKWVNDKKDDVIHPGNALKIPPVTGLVHKVVSGENIYTIAKKYKTDAQKIVNFPFNDFADLDTFALTPGQALYVPDGIIENEQQKYIAQQQMFAQVQSGVKGSSSFIWPTTGIITQYPIWYHMALDIANSAAPLVIASDTGTVVYSGCLRYGYGCHVIIDHGNGYTTLYGHLSRIDVSAGQVISKGGQVGQMGSTGRSTGTHLHFEIRSGGTLLSPLNFLK